MKIIKYKVERKRPHTVMVKKPLLDEEGKQVTEEVVTPVTGPYEIFKTDENGEYVRDENGELIIEVVEGPLFDKSGEPLVTITYEPVFVEVPEIEQEVVLLNAAVQCRNEDSLRKNLTIVESVAVPDSIEITGEFDPVETGSTSSIENRVGVLEDASATKDELQEMWDSMAAAYNEGVQNA